jgi:hypothetical protein
MREEVFQISGSHHSTHADEGVAQSAWISGGRLRPESGCDDGGGKSKTRGLQEATAVKQALFHDLPPRLSAALEREMGFSRVSPQPFARPHFQGKSRLDSSSWRTIVCAMKRLLKWIVLTAMLLSLSSCGIPQLAGRTLGNTLKSVGAMGGGG